MISFPLAISVFFIGVVHALEPGHGKTALIATMMGSRLRFIDPLRIGAATAVGHTAGMVLFTQISFLVAKSAEDIDARSIFEVIVGGLVLCFGLFSTTRTSNANKILASTNSGEHTPSAEKGRASSSDCCASPICHSHPHGKKNDNKRSHGPMIGFLLGMVPCPSALTLALAGAVGSSSLELLILAILFGLGVSTTLTLIGIVLIIGRDRLLKTLNTKLLDRLGTWLMPLIYVFLGIWLIFHSMETHSS